jgi:hypothetical protein
MTILRVAVVRQTRCALRWRLVVTTMSAQVGKLVHATAFIPCGQLGSAAGSIWSNTVAPSTVTRTCSLSKWTKASWVRVGGVVVAPSAVGEVAPELSSVAGAAAEQAAESSRMSGAVRRYIMNNDYGPSDDLKMNGHQKTFQSVSQTHRPSGR